MCTHLTFLGRRELKKLVKDMVILHLYVCACHLVLLKESGAI